MNIEYDFGLHAEDVASYKGVQEQRQRRCRSWCWSSKPADGKAEDVMQTS